MFAGKHLSAAARRAALAHGLSTVGQFEALNLQQPAILNDDDAGFEVVVVRAYSPGGKKVVDVTAGDIFYYSTVLADAPMCRVV